MPLTCQIYHLDRLVIGVSDGTVTLKDIGDFIDKVVQEGAQPYRKIFDARRGTSGLGPDDLTALSHRLRTRPKARPLGPFAVIAGNDRDALVEILKPFAALKRPMRLFKDMPSARRWIDHQKIVVG
jgi:hypothetical protein